MASGSKPNNNNPIGDELTPARANLPTGTSPQPVPSTFFQANLTSLKAALEGLKPKLNGLPPVQLAVVGLQDCLPYIQMRERTRHEYEKVMSDLASLANSLKADLIKSNPQSVPDSIANLARAIKEQVNTIKQWQAQIGQSTMSMGNEETVLECYRRIGQLFSQLQADVSLSVWNEKSDLMAVHLKDLLPVHEAYYNAAASTTVTERVPCTEGTRVDLLNGTWNWTQRGDAAPIYWLNGMAGTGKTTITYTLCKMLQEDKRLGGSFFCSRNSPNCGDVNRIVPTIAYQLGRYSNPYRQALARILAEDPDISRRGISTQFADLIAKPLAEIGKATFNKVVVVIDALDECNDVRGIRDVLNMLLRHAGNLPIKFFVASRPEPAISDRMTGNEGNMRSILWLHDIEKSLVQVDIKTYLAKALHSVQVSPSEIDALAERAGCLFIFAATAVRYILPTSGAVDSKQRLHTVLGIRSSRGNKTYKDIDELYVTILENALDGEVFEDAELAQRRRVLRAVVCAKEPLTVPALAELLEISEVRAVEVAVKPLQSVLHLSETSSVLSTLHASFPDFLLDKERAGKFHCDEVAQSADLAECCFQLMCQSLHFNICSLESSYMLDQDVPDLQVRLNRAISSGLFYSCMCWDYHLTKCPLSSRLTALLNSFMQEKLLFWIEVLNLKRNLTHGDRALGQVLIWLSQKEKKLTDLQDFVYDARNFIVMFASNPASLSTPHIYISALPFTAKTSRVWAAYWPRMQGLIRVEGSATDANGTSVIATWAVADPVNSIAQSSDGKHIASGSDDWFRGRGEVSVRDISSGIRTIGPLDGHSSSVLSVAFSPKDNHIASGSVDRTICIWDASDGRLVAGPLRGHTHVVRSVSFSPDGSFLASGSDDLTIRMWDAYSGAQVENPLKGHQGSVMSVTFSPDLKHLASGSRDCSIRVWDWRTRVVVSDRFIGHTQAVYSIAYSSDGLRLVSSSEDHTVRVWDVATGTSLAGPFNGHTDAVFSAAFSPNGSLVVSGSRDRTIRVWEATSGMPLTGPLKGHDSWVSSVLFTIDGTRILSGSDDRTIRVWDRRQGPIGVNEDMGHTRAIRSLALSPDGTRIASGSYDHTVCIWNVHNGALIAPPCRGHTGCVNSVAFSPDGARIVSGSRDGTLRIWDTSTSMLLAGPFKGHTDSVLSVAFSPDGNQIASGSGDGTIHIWYSYSGRLLIKLSESRNCIVTSIAYSPDGTRLVSGFQRYRDHNFHFLHNSDESSVRLWDTGHLTTPVWTSFAHGSSAECVAFSPDGAQVALGSHNLVLVLDACNGTVLYGPFKGHTESSLSVTFSLDGMRVISVSRDQTVHMWNLQSDATDFKTCFALGDFTEPPAPLGVDPDEGHTRWVTSIVCSPNGAHIISSPADRTVRLWNLTSTTNPDSLFPRSSTINHDGWLINPNSQLLLWVPPDLRKDFQLPTLPNTSIISSKCSSFIDNNMLFLGDQWPKCYRPSLLFNM